MEVNYSGEIEDEVIQNIVSMVLKEFGVEKYHFEIAIRLITEFELILE